MATITRNDESLAERDEVLYPNTDLIDVEPHYDNFTAIQNALRQPDERKQTNITTRSIRNQFESSSLSHSHSNERLDITNQHSSNPFVVPINIQSKKIDGHIFNLTQIVENIGYDRNTQFIRSSPSSNTKNVSALLNIVLKLGGAHGPLANIWRSQIKNDDFERWYLEKHYQRSASLTQHNTMNNINEKTTHTTRGHDSVLTKLPRIDYEKPFRNEIKQVYGYDDVDGASSVSSQSSFSDLDLKTSFYANQQRSSSLTSILKKPNSQNSPNKHHVTIREQVDQKPLNENNQHILTDYQQFLHHHPDLYNDQTPEIITKPNPEQITYQQNISVRYLVPPTPPPPGPLIIREILPPRVPSPPPLVITHQEPSPSTPPPLILREAPPPPPPQQETTVLTKILPSEPQSSRRVIVEHNTPLPPKPQSIIIEKWLPYKSPPREVIYEHITEKPIITEFEPDAICTDRHRRHSAEFQVESSRGSIPVNHQRRNSLEHLEREYYFEQPTETFDQLAWRSHQQILALQQRGREQVQAHQQWAANQWQQHANTYLQYPLQLPTPSLVLYQHPASMNPTSYVQTQEFRQRVQYDPALFYPLY